MLNMTYILIIITIMISLIPNLLRTEDEKDSSAPDRSLLKKPTKAGTLLIFLTFLAGAFTLYTTYADARRKDAENDRLRADLKMRTDLTAGLILGRQTQNPQAKLVIRTDLFPSAPPAGVKPESYQFLIPLIYPKVYEYAVQMETPAGLSVTFADLDAPVRNPFDEVGSDTWEVTYFMGPQKEFGLGQLGTVGGGTRLDAQANLSFVEPAVTRKDTNGNVFGTGFGLDLHSIDLDHSISSVLLYKDRKETGMVASFELDVQHQPTQLEVDELTANWKHFHSSIWLLIDEPSSICTRLRLHQEPPEIRPLGGKTVKVKLGWSIEAGTPDLQVCPDLLFFKAETYRQTQAHR
jgi:hypothetical protein